MATWMCRSSPKSRPAANRWTRASCLSERMDEVVEGLVRLLVARRPRLLGLPARRGERARRSRRCRGSRQGALAAAFPGRTGLVHGRMKGPEKDARHGAVQIGRDRAPRLDHGHRGRRRCAGSHRDGDRECRALRPGAAPSIARPRRPRRQRIPPAFCSIRRRSARPQRRGSSIMRETDDGFRIAEEDLRLRGAGEMLGTRQAGLPVSGSPISPSMAIFSPPRAMMPPSFSRAIRSLRRRAARPCAVFSICSSATTRCD